MTNGGNDCTNFEYFYEPPHLQGPRPVGAPMEKMEDDSGGPRRAVK